MKKSLACILAIIMMLSIVNMLQTKSVEAEETEEWLEVSDYETFRKAMCAYGTQKIKLVKDIEKCYNPGDNNTPFEITMQGNKTIDLNGHELFYNDNSNADNLYDSVGGGHASVSKNCNSTFIKIAKGATLVLENSGSSGKIRTRGYCIGMSSLGSTQFWDFYLSYCYRHAIYVEGTLIVKGGRIEAGASKSQYLDRYGLKIDGSSQNELSKIAYHVIRGTAVTVADGGTFISLGGRYDGHMTPTIDLQKGSTTYWYDGTVCAQCSGKCMDVDSDADLTVWSGKFETYYHQYVRGTDYLPGGHDVSDEKAVDLARTFGGNGTKGLLNNVYTCDYGHIGIPVSAFASGSTVKQNMKDEYDPDFKGNTTVTAKSPINDTDVKFTATGKINGSYTPGYSCKITASCPDYFTNVKVVDDHTKYYFWQVYDCSTNQYMELSTNDKLTYMTSVGTLELASILAYVKAELKENTAYRVFCTIQEGFEGADSDPIIHTSSTFAQFTVSKNRKIGSFTVKGTIKANDILNQSGPITVSMTEGIKEVSFGYEKDGKTLKDGTKAVYGNYDCYIQLTAKDGFEFNSSASITYNGEIYLPDSVSSDGKICWFILPTTHVDCIHGNYVWQHSEMEHWKVCSTCKAKYALSNHNFNSVVSGSMVTYTCKDCGYVKTGKVAETRTAVRNISIKIDNAFVGGKKPDSVLLEYMTDADDNKHYDFATVQSIEWSESGSTFKSGQQSVTITLKAKENYYFKSTSFPYANLQYTRDDYGPVNDTTLKVTFLFTPYTMANVTVKMPEFIAGKTYIDAIENTVVTLNGEVVDDFGISLTPEGQSGLVGTVSDGSVAESYFNKTISNDQHFEYSVTIYHNKMYGKNITVTNPEDFVVTDTYTGENLTYVTGNFTSKYSDLASVAISNVTFPAIGDDIETGASAGGAQSMKKALGGGIHYKVKNIKYDATGKFTCGKEYTVTAVLEALDGYRFSKNENMKNVSINGQKVEKYNVSSDGLTLTMSYTFEAIEHDIEITRTDATCDKSGTLVSKCKVCKKEISTETIPATGHEYIEKGEIKATCTETGVKKHYECALCGRIFDENKKETTEDKLLLQVDKKNHIGGEPECDENSHFTLCSCGEKLNKESHKFGDWQILLEATKEQKGVKVCTCSVCGYTKSEVLIFGEDEPKTTEKPVETEKPGTTEEPNATEKPDITEEPDNTAGPDGTEAPKATNPPKSTKEPDSKPDDNKKSNGWIWIAVIAMIVVTAGVCIVFTKKKGK